MEPFAKVFAKVVAGALALGGCSSEPSMAEKLEQAAQRDKAEKAAQEAKLAELAAAKAKEPKALEMPWKASDVRRALPAGSSLTYAIRGTNEKGKPVEDEFVAEIEGNTEEGVRFKAYRRSQAKNPAVTQLQSGQWSQLSPLFAVEQAETSLVRREPIQVPAGTFDTVVVELKGFFGQHYTAWMVEDRPGVYAKVEEHPKIGQEGDKTALTYELTTIDASK